MSVHARSVSVACYTAALALVACGPGVQEPSESIEVTPTFLFMSVGDTMVLEIGGSAPEALGVKVTAQDGRVVSPAGLAVEAVAEGVSRVFIRAGDLADTITVVVGGVRADRIETGGGSTCALTEGGVVFCWGNNWFGQGGSGRPEQILTRPFPVELQGSIQQLTVGGTHACALTLAGSVLCWGRGDYGQLGDGKQGEHRVSTPVHLKSSVRFKLIDAGTRATCGLALDDTLYCWGSNRGGVAGQSLGTRRVPEPRRVTSPVGFVAVSVGGSACGLTPAGKVYCWGPNELGQIGVQEPPVSEVPLEVPLPATVQAVAVGDMHACALSTSGQAYCWGRNLEGQLGVADITVTHVPQRVPLDVKLASIHAGGTHTCAVSEGGEAYCWGSNWRGELGRGTYASPPFLPVGRVLTDRLFRDLTASSEHHSCGVSIDRMAFCWGWNKNAETGTGSSEDVVLTPQAVAFPGG